MIIGNFQTSIFREDMYTRVSMEVSLQSYLHMDYNPFTNYHGHPSMYIYIYINIYIYMYIYIYTWNPNDL